MRRRGSLPPLDWSDVPAATGSFVLLCDDPDAPAGTWHHWAAYDIAAGQTALPLDAGKNAEKLDFKQAINDFQRPGYGGPCPPHGGARRIIITFVCWRSHWTGCRCRPKRPAATFERKARKHTLAEAVLVGIYRR